MKLSDKDYYKILDFYNISYSDKTSIKTVRKRAEKALAEKLCRCIKKVKKSTRDKSEQRPIAICRKSVLHNKNLKISGRFTCKKRARFISSKSSRQKLTKFR